MPLNQGSFFYNFESRSSEGRTVHRFEGSGGGSQNLSCPWKKMAFKVLVIIKFNGKNMWV